MRVAFGMKAHSGWASLVVLGTRGGELQVVDRSRMELVEPRSSGEGRVARGHEKGARCFLRGASGKVKYHPAFGAVEEDR